MATLTDARQSLDTLYRAAIDADDAFSAALRRTYGSKASIMRYRSTEHSPALRAYADASLVALDTWRAAYRLSLHGQNAETRALDSFYR